jgi:SAM-dependent methyltransferase
MTAPYKAEYFAGLNEGSSASASDLVPLVVQLVGPKSVIDVGCGTGAWLAAFKRNGVTDVCGVDGPYVDTAQLEVEPSEFVPADLTQPFKHTRQFDLALSLEVAEHLPSQTAGELIGSLTALAPVVLFSAAVPDQGGETHLNEQWPAYWIERFEARGFTGLDPFRRLLWQRPQVDWWYAQNMLLFIRNDQLLKYLPQIARLREMEEATAILPLVHPDNYQQYTWRNRVLEFAVDLATLVPTGEQILLVDENRFGSVYLPGRCMLPFLEHNGSYAGPPHDDNQAITELHRMQKAGANFIAFGWPSFWWLAHYHKFADHLEQRHTCVHRSDRLILFLLLNDRDPTGLL